MASTITFLGTDTDQTSPRDFFHLPSWTPGESRAFADDYCLSEGFGDSAGLVTALRDHFPESWFRVEKPGKATKSAPTDTPASPAEE